MKATSIVGRKTNKGLDFYSTPIWATEALFEKEKFVGEVWECASGSGDMVRVIEKHNKVFASDIRHEGYGKGGLDFLLMTTQRETANIITNPPFKYALQFVEKAKTQATKKIAMFLKLTFLESVSRHQMFLDKEFPLKKVIVFCKRVNLYPAGEKEPKNSGTIAFAWYVWDKDYEGKPYIEWIR